jgi:glycosyltransferase involved in cell wall biosynthesis
MELISVILTTYNSERSLQRILDSIISQEGYKTLFDLELIVIDDCSTDSTTEILRKNGVAYESNEANSGGPNKGRNMGLKKAKGRYICIADHDDEWLPQRIISQLRVADKAPIISSGFFVIDAVNQKKIMRVNAAGGKEKYVLYPSNTTFRALLSKSRKGQNVYFGSLFYSAELKHILFEEHFGMVDFDWVLRLFEGRSSLEICAPLYNRYISGRNLSLNEAYRTNDFNYSLQTLKKYSGEYPKETHKAYKRIQGSMARYFYLVGKMAKARYHFIRSGLSMKTMLYLLTSYAGSGFVKKHFNIFG